MHKTKKIRQINNKASGCITTSQVAIRIVKMQLTKEVGDKMEQDYTVIKVEHRRYLFKLKALLKQRGITNNQLVKDTNTDFKVIKRIANGNLIRIDIYVLDRLCEYLSCQPNDIIEYQKES